MICILNQYIIKKIEDFQLKKMKKTFIHIKLLKSDIKGINNDSNDFDFK